MKTYWICRGDVRGQCPHKHRTLSAAFRCLQEDRVGCSRQGGYSDRVVVRIEDGKEIVEEIEESND